MLSGADAILTALILFALAALMLGIRNVYTSATAVFGQEWAHHAVEQAKRMRSLREARRRVRQGASLVVLLAAAAPAPSRSVALEAQRELARRIAPTPGAAALIHTIEDTASPFHGRRAALIGIGSGICGELDVALRATGRRAVGDWAFAVDPRPSATRSDRVLTSSGDVWNQLDTALRWAQRAIETDQAEFLAVLLRTPVMGDWLQDTTIDVPRLVRTLFAQREHPIWLTLTEPADPTAWPDEVTLTLPLSARSFQRTLRRSGFRPAVAHARTGRRTLHMRSVDAAGLLIAASTPLSVHPSEMTSGAVTRRYSAEITLALRDAARAGDAHVELEDSVSRGLQALFDAAGARFTTGNPSGADLLLPMSVYPNRLIAWQMPGQSEPVSSHRPVSPMAALPSRWLSEACESQDESVAAAVLADHGRAWIESHNLDSALPLLERALHAFPRGSRAHLWAHYLVALDAALRLSRPDARWFDNELCSLADHTELGLLYRVERMEFSRLRGDLGAACSDLNALADRLNDPIGAVNSADAYAQGTARYVAANTLRRGGRYDRARDLIDAAVASYDTAVPAHRIELTHGTYAIAVCDSLRGVASVRATNWGEGQGVFASSLVTLANSHASWFVEDYQRAVDFAHQARTGFESIGYQRYANRARDLARLISEWARRSGRLVDSAMDQPDERVCELLSVPREGRTGLLVNERPSRALSLLHFAVSFGDEPDAPRTVELPQYIAIQPDNSYLLRTPPPASSFRQAEQAMRNILGVGTGTRLPLNAD